MGTVILVRHGDMRRDAHGCVCADALSEKAKEFALRLPKLLAENGYADIDLVYYSVQKKTQPGTDRQSTTRRCRMTVAHFKGSEQHPFVSSQVRGTVFGQQNRTKTILVCYQSEHLDSFPRLDGEELIEFMRSNCPHREPRQEYTDPDDVLYEQILVATTTDTGLTKPKWIRTGTYKKDK